MNLRDYVRTKDGIIAKCYKYEAMNYFFDKPLYIKYGYDVLNYIRRTDIKDVIIKSSPNIIDLIEVGDYVNGARVTNFMFDGDKKFGVFVEATAWGYDANEIKSIATKEQFSQMEYKINE